MGERTTTAPRERPIIMSAESVRAILAGRKTQTRRLVKLTRFHEYVEERPEIDGGGYWPTFQSDSDFGEWDWSPCPFGKPGDRLWVREAMRWTDDHRLVYAADGEPARGDGREWSRDDVDEVLFRPRSPIHMPRAASRLLLEVVAVRVERLCDISESEAVAEGILKLGADFCGAAHRIKGTPTCHTTAKEAYRSLWDSIHGAGSWERSPWVWVVEFRRVEPAGKAVANAT